MSSIQVLCRCSPDSNTRYHSLGLENGLKDLWNEIVMNSGCVLVRDFLFFTFFVGSSNFINLRRFVVEVLRNFRA